MTVPDPRDPRDPGIAVAGRCMVWIDHRDGEYRIAVADLLARTENWATPEEALVEVAIAAAVSDELVV